MKYHIFGNINFYYNSIRNNFPQTFYTSFAVLNMRLWKAWDFLAPNLFVYKKLSN